VNYRVEQADVGSTKLLTLLSMGWQPFGVTLNPDKLETTRGRIVIWVRRQEAT
jgi:hypothetical protein